MNHGKRGGGGTDWEEQWEGKLGSVNNMRKNLKEQLK